MCIRDRYNTSGEDLDEKYNPKMPNNVDLVTGFEIIEHLVSPYPLLKNIKAKQAEFVLQHHQFTSDDPSNIVINGNKLSINEARKFLNNPNNLKTLEKLYTSAAENIGDPNAFPEGDLSDSEKATLTALRLMPRDIKRDTNRVADLTKLETEVAWNNYKNLLQMKNSYGKELFEAYVDGIPNIFGGDTRGGEGFRGRDATSILSKE